jgi:predicted DsbA family dithiol-disulfide isomerase
LERAISLYQKTYPGGRDDVFSIKWRPYYLDYNPSPHSVDKSELVEARLSGMSPEQRTALFQRMNRIGLSVGIIFKAGGKIGSTRDAHRLIHLSQSQPPGIQNALVEKLFEAYHELEKDISSHEVLREVALDVGLDEVDVAGCLSASSDLEGDGVDEEAQKNKEAVGSVPVFIIQGVNQIDGAQDPTDFMEVFVKVREGETPDR